MPAQPPLIAGLSPSDLLALATKNQSSKDSRVKTLADAVVHLLGTPDYTAAEKYFDEGYSQGVADTTRLLTVNGGGYTLPVLNLTELPPFDIENFGIPGLSDEEADDFQKALTDDPEHAVPEVLKNSITIT